MNVSSTIGSLDVPADFTDLIREHALRRPSAGAIVCGPNTVDYATLDRVSSQIANALLAAGVCPGDRIAYVGQDSEIIYELLIGAAKCGVVLIPVNWRLAAPEIAHILRDSLCRLVFVDPVAESVVAQAQSENDRSVDTVPLPTFDTWLRGHPDTDPHIESGPDDPFLQLYTSGTTGLSKGVVIAQRSIYAARQALLSPEADWLDLGADDRILVMIPSFHIAGLGWIIQGLFFGATNVMLPEFGPAAAMDAIRAHEVTVLVGVPVMFAFILADPTANRASLSTLRMAAYGGSPIPETLLAQCIERFGCKFLQFYGMTEAAWCITYLPPSDHTPGNPRLRSAGRAAPGVELVVRDADGNALAPGETGEIVLRSPATMVSYWNNPDATAATVIGGWLHTGDAGWIDEDGYLFLCDRIKDMIIVCGENVFPAEVENAIVAHPAVREAAVIGVPDDKRGEAVHAFVVVHQGHSVTSRELTRFLRERVAPFKMPAKFEFIDYVPRNATGKILHRQLREDFWAGRQRAIN